MSDKKINLNTVSVSHLHMITGMLPENAVEEINKHIDDVIIPTQDSVSYNLVGQINQDKKSSQLDFDLKSPYGQNFKGMLDGCATSLLTEGYKRKAKADAIECWTVHSYAGDYNPFHSHGTLTPAGLSCIIYLKVPDCIKEKPEVPTLNGASGDCDGFTQLVWDTSTTYDAYGLYNPGQEMIKPEVGKMLIFPKWLNHQVWPFFGEGERRTLSANFNVYYSKEESKKYGLDGFDYEEPKEEHTLNDN